MLSRAYENFLKTFFILAGFVIAAVFVSLPQGSVFASAENGTINDSYKYAWADRAGWLNFDAQQGGVTIRDASLSGYAWSENFGWINLNPPGSGVNNNSEGDLSGYAWGENTGWIDFSAVGIDSLGRFTGTATGDIVGTISFNCANCVVKTDWRPKSQRGGSGLPAGSGSVYGGGGGAPPALSILINNGDKYAKSRDVILKLYGGSDAKTMAISESPVFEGIAQEPYRAAKTFVLSQGDGEKTIYVKFYNQYGQPSSVVSDSIILKTGPPEIKITYIKQKYGKDEEVIIGGETEGGAEIFVYFGEYYSSFEADETGEWLVTLGKLAAGKYKIEMIPRDGAGNSGAPVSAAFEVSEEEQVLEEGQPEFKLWQNILEKIKKGLKLLLPKFLRPEEIEKGPKIITKIPKKIPLALTKRWVLLPMEPIRRFALSPLPKSVSLLAEKFPRLQQTFKEVGVSKITDVQKIKQAKIKLPGLTETLGIARTEIAPGKFAPPKGIPIAKLSPEMKQEIPSEIVFAKTGGELIDFNIALSIDEKGETKQTIRTIVGEPLELTIKPDKPVKRVVGYIVFKSKKPKEPSFKIPLASFTASLMFETLNLAKEQEEPVRVEEALVLVEFEYKDAGDGIWTATVPAPVVDGEYEIITVMEYEDEKLLPKEIRLVTVVDPEGYVFEKDGNRETRVTGAIVQLFWLDPVVKQYELWTAAEYQQENPQTTDVRGTYSFLVPEGFYYLKVDAPGYLSYDGKPFEVKEGSGVHINIELKTQYWWLKLVDWKTVLLILVIFMLVYNFYRDRMREKSRRISEQEAMRRRALEQEALEREAKIAIERKMAEIEQEKLKQDNLKQDNL